MERFLDNQAELCLQAYPNLRITCATAYEQRILLNEHECRDLCLKMSAKTCQYNKIRMKSCVPSVTPTIGFLLFVNDDCDFGESKHVNRNVTSKQSTFTAPGNNNITMMRQGKKSVIMDDKTQEVKINATVDTIKLYGSTSYYSSRKNEPQNEFRNIAMLSNPEDCLAGFSVYIEAIDGIQVIDEGMATFQTRTPKICLHKCMKNTLNNGSLLPTNCRSVQYDRITKRCILFNTSITPIGNAYYTPNENTVYFEKICISDMVRRKCEIVLRRIPQYILVGHATAAINASSHNYCIEMCLRSLEMLAFTCRSAIYFYEYSKSNCILNKDSAQTRPEYFTNEREQKVDYIEMDECHSTRGHSLNNLINNRQ
uniref:Apple domain-containing protein n=1 Tax=Onchocerca volvulus TaxID=6282 RepID=A0A8R1XZL7_ONCVO